MRTSQILATLMFEARDLNTFTIYYYYYDYYDDYDHDGDTDDDDGSTDQGMSPSPWSPSFDVRIQL